MPFVVELDPSSFERSLDGLHILGPDRPPSRFKSCDRRVADARSITEVEQAPLEQLAGFLHLLASDGHFPFLNRTPALAVLQITRIYIDLAEARYNTSAI